MTDLGPVRCDSVHVGAMISAMCPRAAILLAVVGLALGIPGTVPAQTTNDSATETPAPIEDFMEIVDVEIVNIDVWITDKQGEPVDGLGKDDFVVLRDGQPVEIANFYAISGGRPAQDREVPEPSDTLPSEPVSEPTVEPEPWSPPDEPEAAPEHRLWLIVYVDNYNIDPLERNRIMPALETFLRRAIDAGAHAMVVTYNRSLEVRQPFTDDMRLLRGALGDLRDDAGQAVIRRRDQMAALRRIDDADTLNQALLYARQYAEEQMSGVGYTVDGLDRLIDTLGGLPGRKALVHVSSGVPMLAGEEMFHAVAVKFDASEPYAEIPRHDTTRSFESVNRRANVQRVSFYTLDAGGLRSFEFGAAEYGGFVSTRILSTLNSVVPENLQAPLRLMALETGGQAIVNRNEILPALDEVVRDFGSFYSLGISSTDVDSGRYHEIKVRLREPRKGVRLRHRSGYRSKSIQTRVRETLRSALLYSHQANPLNVEVEWGRAEPQGAGKSYILPIRLAVPMESVVVLPVTEDRHEVRLNLFVGAVDEDGGISEIDLIPIGLRLDAENVAAAKRESLLRTHKLRLARGRQKVGVAILDVFGSQSSIVTRIIQVGPDEFEAGAGR